MEDILAGVSDEWRMILENDELRQIIDKLPSNIEPCREEIFNAMKLTDISNIKCVIIGQDPYPTPGVAMGLSFSARGKIPPSLRNIYKCLQNCGEIAHIPTGADLSNWARQGVLLLNMALTTESSKTRAHSALWKKYILRVVEDICKYHDERDQKLIFMLWGRDAESVKNYLREHIALTWRHPSPMANKSESDPQHFMYCDHFARANKEYGCNINWGVI